MFAHALDRSSIPCSSYKGGVLTFLFIQDIYHPDKEKASGKESFLEGLVICKRDLISQRTHVHRSHTHITVFISPPGITRQILVNSTVIFHKLRG